MLILELFRHGNGGSIVLVASMSGTVANRVSFRPISSISCTWTIACFCFSFPDFRLVRWFLFMDFEVCGCGTSPPYLWSNFLSDFVEMRCNGEVPQIRIDRRNEIRLRETPPLFRQSRITGP